MNITTLQQGTVCTIGRVKPRASGKSLSKFISGKYFTGCWTQFYCWKLWVILPQIISCKAMLSNLRGFMSTLENSLHEEERSQVTQVAVMSLLRKHTYFFLQERRLLKKMELSKKFRANSKDEQSVCNTCSYCFEVIIKFRLQIKQKNRSVLWMIKPSLDDTASILNDLSIYNAVKIDWKQNPQLYTQTL